MPVEIASALYVKTFTVTSLATFQADHNAWVKSMNDKGYWDGVRIQTRPPRYQRRNGTIVGALVSWCWVRQKPRKPRKAPARRGTPRAARTVIARAR